MNIFRFMQLEFSYFNKLSILGKRLLVSYILFELASPLLSIFTNAFLWRYSNSFFHIIVYNLALFVVSPFIFYLNGLLLRKYSPTFLYLIGCILLPVSTILVVFFPSVETNIIILYGIISGIGNSFYWANLKLITLPATTREDRVYFSAIQSSAGTFINVVIPAVAGYIIVVGENTHLYSATFAYQSLSFIALFIMVLAGVLVHNFPTGFNAPAKIALTNISSSWNKFRMLQLSDGIVGGSIYFVPTLMVLLLVGKEDALGLIQSITSILSGVVVYIIGRILPSHKTLTLLGVALLIYLAGSLFFSINFAFLGVIVYYITLTLFQPLQWTALSPITNNLIDDEKERHKHNEYQYIFDIEIFLNLGRVVGTVVILGLLQITTQEAALRYAPLGLALIQQLQWVLAYYILKKS